MTKPSVAKWAGLTALWVFIGLLLTIEVYFNMRVSMPAVNFWEVAWNQYQRALLWALLVPVVLRLKKAVPLNTGRWAGGVTFHLTASFAVMAAYYLARVAYNVVAVEASFAEFWEWAARSFYGRNLIDMVYYWAVIGVSYSLRIRENFQRESLKAALLEGKLVEAELRALKQQLNPHFLFNTMNTIAVLVREQKNDEAVTLIARISTLLRMALENTRVQTVSLRQELEFLTRYLDIQKARFGERLHYRTDVAPEALDAIIPNLILQPLVENAVLHGVAQKTGPGCVEIAARVRENRLEIEVRDDGPGLSTAREEPTKEGIGLSNTRIRLDRHYGAAQQMVVRSEKGRGVSVHLVLPFATPARLPAPIAAHS
ncbi:MAG: sensor histidine kinase [Opitutae bacterium]|nr:sensor histidine kinase [Opitutae bacterium]